jgi:hypothetical protein
MASGGCSPYMPKMKVGDNSEKYGILNNFVILFWPNFVG